MIGRDPVLEDRLFKKLIEARVQGEGVSRGWLNKRE